MTNTTTTNITTGYKLELNDNTKYFFVTPQKSLSAKLIKQVKQQLTDDGKLTPTIIYSLRSKLKHDTLDLNDKKQIVIYIK